MKSSLRIGRLFGIPIDLHWTLLLVLAWIFYDGYYPSIGFQWSRIGWVSAVIVLLFFFVLVHELGHGLVAKAYGKPTEKILLFPLGGGAYIREQPENRLGEILVYFGGPMANLLLAFLIFPFLFFDADRWLLLQQYIQPERNLFSSALWWEELLCLSLVVNIVLMFLNLLPAYPLDGGRIVQALLRKSLGVRKATLVVTISGIITGIAFLFIGYSVKDYLMAIGGVFICLISAYEINRGWQRRRLEKYFVATVYRPMLAGKLYVSDTPAKAYKMLQQTQWPSLAIYNDLDQMQGFVNEETLELATSDQNLIGAYDAAFATGLKKDNLLLLTERIIEADAYGALIFEDQMVVGFLFMDDIMPILRRRFRWLTK